MFARPLTQPSVYGRRLVDSPTRNVHLLACRLIRLPFGSIPFRPWPRRYFVCSLIRPPAHPPAHSLTSLTYSPDRPLTFSRARLPSDRIAPALFRLHVCLAPACPNVHQPDALLPARRPPALPHPSERYTARSPSHPPPSCYPALPPALTPASIPRQPSRSLARKPTRSPAFLFSPPLVLPPASSPVRPVFPPVRLGCLLSHSDLCYSAHSFPTRQTPHPNAHIQIEFLFFF